MIANNNFCQDYHIYHLSLTRKLFSSHIIILQPVKTRTSIWYCYCLCIFRKNEGIPFLTFNKMPTYFNIQPFKSSGYLLSKCVLVLAGNLRRYIMIYVRSPWSHMHIHSFLHNNKMNTKNIQIIVHILHEYEGNHNFLACTVLLNMWGIQVRISLSEYFLYPFCIMLACYYYCFAVMYCTNKVKLKLICSYFNNIEALWYISYMHCFYVQLIVSDPCHLLERISTGH